MTPHLQDMINNKSVYIYSRFTYHRNGATSKAADGAFSPTALGIWRWGYFQA